MMGCEIIMNSKERVMTALRHEQPDRIPCDYIGTPEIDDVLKKHFGTEDMDVVLEHLGVDLRIIKLPYVGPKLRTWDDGTFENFWGHIRKAIRNDTGTSFDSVEFPYADFKTLDDVEDNLAKALKEINNEHEILQSLCGFNWL